MQLNKAIAILNADLLGLRQKEYSNAWLTIAFSDEDLSDTPFNQEAMRDILATTLARQTGGTKSVLLSVINSPLDAKAVAARNYIDLKWVLEAFLMQCDKPVNSYDLALVVLAAGPEAPKFNDALGYVMETGTDVPQDVRSQVVEQFNDAVAESESIRLSENGEYEVTE
ncbi:hypothetical protein [Vibrio harveyi]|uniref:hypothetical protein n=1 Tax=Vibrio harveyi TaxID=669 RepID=UPI0025B12FF0|nr:hypothetical protein [Vibrio harveyi]WJT09257.1 hypothetical protein PH545_24840 [Vibrio harveyi]